MAPGTPPRFTFRRPSGRIEAGLIIAAGLALAVALGFGSGWADLTWGPLVAIPVVVVAAALIGVRAARVSVRVIGDLMEVRNLWRDVRVPAAAIERITVEWVGSQWSPLSRPRWRGRVHTDSGVVRVAAFDTFMIGPQVEQAVTDLTKTLGLPKGPLFVGGDTARRRRVRRR